MPEFGQNGETWGLSGPKFLLLYAALALSALIIVYVVRRWILTGGGDARPTSSLNPYEVAYLASGPDLAVAASLGALRAHQSVGTAGRRVLTVTGRLPGGAAPLDGAIYNAVANGRVTSVRRLTRDSQVGRTLDDLGSGLRHAGLLVSPAARRRMRWVTLVFTAVLVLGVLRWIDGTQNGRPVGFLTAGLVVLVVIQLLLLRRPPWRTRRGDAALATLRTEYQHLSPAAQPSWGLYGATGAAMAVGLFGGAALWAADPTFAAEADVHRNLGVQSMGASGSGYSGSSCGGSSCSGGSSCGGGGCGGGGCGG